METTQMDIFDIIDDHNKLVIKPFVPIINRHVNCYKNTSSTQRVKVFKELMIWFKQVIMDNKDYPNRPWAFYGKKLYCQGNTYFCFGDLNDSIVVDGKVHKNICKNDYTLLWQKHRTLDDYKKMICKSFEEWNNG